MVASRARCTTR
jgi:Tol biopolymer transport system component